MSTRACKACGTSFRKGTRVLMATGDGTLDGAIVCDGCARRGLVILPVVGGAKCRCGEVAAVCAGCAVKAANNAVAAADGMTGAVKVMRGWVTAAEHAPSDPFAQGRCSGIESAIALLETGRR